MRVARKVVRPIEAAQVRRFGRSSLPIAFHTPVLVLHTTGRRSKLERATTLAFHAEDDGSLFVDGQARIPDWVANLRADPTAAVTLDRRRFDVITDELTDDEREQQWQAAREGVAADRDLRTTGGSPGAGVPAAPPRLAATAPLASPRPSANHCRSRATLR